MEFKTRIVTRKRNKRAYLAYAGMVIAASSLILVFIPSMEDDIPYVFGVGIAIVVIGALVARGDVRSYGLSEEELIVSLEGIRAGSLFHPLKMITELDFDVQAFDGMYVNDGAMVSGSNSDGMTNSVSFKSGGSKVEVGFYLQSQQHVAELGQIFHAFYERHIPFVEHSKSTRTYLFKVLTAPELVEFKKRYGYA